MTLGDRFAVVFASPILATRFFGYRAGNRPACMPTVAWATWMRHQDIENPAALGCADSRTQSSWAGPACGAGVCLAEPRTAKGRNLGSRTPDGIANRCTKIGLVGFAGCRGLVRSAKALRLRQT